MTHPSRVLVIYNRYSQRGGEDEVFESETQLLEKAGLEVRCVEAQAEEPTTLLGSLRAGAEITWSPSWRSVMLDVIDDFRPQVMHVHNWFPNMSPSILWAARERAITVVVTLHNFRLLCVRATLYRSGAVCERCVALPAAFPGVVYGCYQSNRLRSAALALGQLTHNLLGTWNKCVDVFLVPSNFARDVFIRASFPPERVLVKRNFLSFDPGSAGGEGEHMLFAGRLSEEKGVRTLLAAARSTPDIQYAVAGSGPLAGEIQSAGLANLEFPGRRSRPEVIRMIQDSRAVLIPSEWYEGFPLIAIETFACGRPIIGSRIGAIAEGVSDGETGLLFRPGSADAMASAVDRLWNDAPLALKLGRAARQHFEAAYSPEQNLEALLDAYAFATELRRSRSPGSGVL